MPVPLGPTWISRSQKARRTGAKRSNEGFVAADEDCELGVPGAAGAAGDRRIEEMHAFLEEGLVQPGNDVRRVRRHLEMRLSFAEPGQDAIRPHRDLLDRFDRRQACQNDVALFSDFARAVGPYHTSFEVCCRRVFPDVVDDQSEATGKNIQGHRTAHCAKPDESDRRGCFSHLCSLLPFPNDRIFVSRPLYVRC